MSSEITLGEMADIVMGQSPPGESCNIHGIGMPLLNGPTEFGPKHPYPNQYTVDVKKQSQKGDLLFCVRGSTTGKMNWADQTYAIGRGIAAIRGKKGYPNSFIRAVIELKLESLLIKATGSTFPNVSKELLHNLRLPFVSPNKAQEIARVVEAFDNRISLFRETNTSLEAIAQALFKSWFIDFEPVHAKAEGREPEGMDAETAALFPGSFEDSELGIIPKNWYVTNLGDAYEINPTRKLKKGELAPYLDMANVPTRGHHADKTTMREMGSGTKFINGDTLLARITPCLENGKTAFVDFLDDNQIGWGSTEFVVLRPKEPIPPYHGYLLARHSAFREFAIQSMSGTSGRQRIQNNVLSRYSIVVPDSRVLELFGSIVSSIQQKISSNSRQAKFLASQRNILLPQLISGQVSLAKEEMKVYEA